MSGDMGRGVQLSGFEVEVLANYGSTHPGNYCPPLSCCCKVRDKRHLGTMYTGGIELLMYHTTFTE